MRIGPSTAPPGENGTMTRTGRVGNSCAWGAGEKPAPSASANTIHSLRAIRFMGEC